MIVPPAPASLSSSRRVAQARRSWRNLTKIGRGSVGGRATFVDCRLAQSRLLAAGIIGFIVSMFCCHRRRASRPETITTRLIRPQTLRQSGAPTTTRGRVEAFKMSRGKIDSYRGNFDGYSLCVDREEFLMKSGKSDLARAVRLRPNGSRGD